MEPAGQCHSAAKPKGVIGPQTGHFAPERSVWSVDLVHALDVLARHCFAGGVREAINEHLAPICPCCFSEPPSAMAVLTKEEGIGSIDDAMSAGGSSSGTVGVRSPLGRGVGGSAGGTSSIAGSVDSHVAAGSLGHRGTVIPIPAGRGGRCGLTALHSATAEDADDEDVRVVIPQSTGASGASLQVGAGGAGGGGGVAPVVL
jgi:hypothetical protein